MYPMVRFFRNGGEVHQVVERNTIREERQQRFYGMQLVLIQVKKQLYRSGLENIIGRKKVLGGCILNNK